MFRHNPHVAKGNNGLVVKVLDPQVLQWQRQTKLPLGRPFLGLPKLQVICSVQRLKLVRTMLVIIRISTDRMYKLDIMVQQITEQNKTRRIHRWFEKL